LEQKIYFLNIMETEWLRGDLLGKGAFARVYSVENLKTGEFYAGKFSGTNKMPPMGEVETVSEKMLEEIKKSRKILKREIKIHSKLSHPNIVQYIDSFNTKSCYEEKEIIINKEAKGPCEVLILEMCPNKSVGEMLALRKRVLPEEALLIVKEVGQALLYLKTNGVIHRDVKPDNIMLCNDMSIKLADFGLAVKNDALCSEVNKTIAGTPNYISPEMLEFKGYSYPTDVWSLGCVFFRLLHSRTPFFARDQKEIFERIKTGKFFFPIHGKNLQIVPDQIQNIIKKMLIKDPNDRIKIENLLEDPLFKKCSLKRLPFESRGLQPTKDELMKYMTSPN
jgi:serine/threonine protein kinase